MRKTALALLMLAAATAPALAQNAPVQGEELRRGEYLARIMDCGGCHTGGALIGQPDPRLALAGSNIGFAIPNLGYFYPPNLTPDRETGLGTWTEEQVVTAVRTGVRPDSRVLAPIMPWHAYAALTDSDARALVRYLRSLPPVRNQVPPMTAAADTAPAPYLTVVVPR